MDSLEGVLESIIYTDQETGYTVARLSPRDGGEEVIVVGSISANPGEHLKLQGRWEKNARYGRRFVVHSYESLLPASIEGVKRYLSSGFIKGIGPYLAEKIVERFGEKTLEIIDKSPEMLLEVDGIGPVRLERIKEAWEEQKSIRDVMLLLQEYGVSPTYAVKLFRFYGKDAARVLKEDPYRLAFEVDGIGFKTADKIALKLGVPKDSLERVKAGIVYRLHRASDEGHTYLPLGELVKRCSKELEVGEDRVMEAVSSLESDKVVLDGERVYLKPLYMAEEGVARRIMNILFFPGSLGDVDVSQELSAYRKEEGIELSQGQQDAIKKALKSKVCIITGGPGTGKTTVLKALVYILEKKGKKVILCSPTGRAAERLSQVVGREAKTIHRLLEFDPSTSTFRRNHENPIDADYLVVDEASMVDVVLMNALLRALRPTSSVVLVGDADQLPSVGPGNVLRDLISSGVVPVVKLKEIFRQARESYIVLNAHRVNKGLFPRVVNKGDFYFIEKEDPEDILRVVKRVCADRIPKAFGFDPIEDVQIITPMKRGVLGTSNLNMELQSLLNPSSRELVRGGRRFRLGDKVIQLKNNYEKEVFNGDVGRVVDMDLEEQLLLVDFRGRIVSYDFSELDEISLAYAISVHKSQGSEYKAVVMPVSMQHYVLLSRNLIYTAMTRAKKLLVIVGSKRALVIGVKREGAEKRYTGLMERLTLPSRPSPSPSSP